MRHAELRKRVCEANRGLAEAGLVVLSFGNASGIDRGSRIVAIKPSGVDYAALRPEDIILVSLDDGRVVWSSASVTACRSHRRAVWT